MTTAVWLLAAAVSGVFGAPVRIPEAGEQATAVAVEGRTLYCGSGGDLCVFDIADPKRPRLLKRVGGFDQLRQIAVDRGWVAVSSRGRGAWLVDARVPAEANLASHYETVEQATGIEIAGDALFVGQRGCGVEFVDISDRAHPQHVRMVQTPESQTCRYENGYLYSGDWHSGETTIIDARDFRAAKVVAATALKGYGDGFDLQGDFIYASTGHHRLRGPVKDPKAPENWGLGHGMEVWNRSDLARPKFVSRVQFPTYWRVGSDLWSTCVSGDWAFCADTWNGLFAVDVTDRTAPTVVGRFTDPDPKDAEAPSRCVASVAVADGVVYAAVDGGGLYVVPCAPARARVRDRGVLPGNVAWREPYRTAPGRFTAWQPPTRGPVHSVAAAGGFLYVGCGSAGCWIMDHNLQIVGRVGDGYARDVVISGGRLLVAEGMRGLGVYSLENPTKPVEVGRVTGFRNGNPNCEWVFSPCARWAICSGRSSGWDFVDLAKPDGKSALWVPGLPWLRPFATRLLAGKWLGYAQTHSFLKWFDLSGETPAMIDTEDKTETRPLGQRLNFIRWRDGCTAFRDDTLLLTRDGKFIRLRAAQDRNADGTPWAGVPAVGCPRGIRPEGVAEWDGGDRVVLVNTQGRVVQLYDLADPARPRYLWHEKVAGYPENAIFAGGRLLVPCGYQGLLCAVIEGAQATGKRHCSAGEFTRNTR